MIKSYRDKVTAEFAEGKEQKKFRVFERVAYRKLKYLMAAHCIEDLRIPHGDREGQWSIRINDQWRICFVWSEGGPELVEIVDYH